MNRSVNNKIWRQKILDEEYICSLTLKFGISELLARLLSHKIKNIDEIESFLDPKIKNTLPDPFHLLDMEKGVERAIKAIKNQENIYIFGDYDVDGATSSALLKNVFRDLGVAVNIYIPDRIKEGYGPTIEVVNGFKKLGADLIITVDCGSSSYEPLKLARELEIDVIVLDHHLSTYLPEASAIINPNRIDETSNLKNLAAVGVSFLFAVAIVSRLKQSNFFDKKTIPDLMQYLDLVALGTTCDMMTLTGINRTFVAAGLKIMEKRKNLGLKALLEISNITDVITPYHLGFILGPKINACGRVGNSHFGATLLSTLSDIEANELSLRLNQYNDERKLIEEQMVLEAIEQASMLENDICLIVVGENWHRGVIGIIAARLKEKFQKPAIVVSQEGDICKASCRSIKNIDLGSKIIRAKEKGILIDGGGHAMAAAFTIETRRLSEFRYFIQESIKKEYESHMLNNVEEYDLDISANSINFELMSEISKLAPYGNGNNEPLVKLSEFFVLRADILSGKHIKCLLTSSRKNYASKAIKAIIFNSIGSNFEEILLAKRPQSMSFIGNLKINNWQNNFSVELHIKDIIL